MLLLSKRKGATGRCTCEVLALGQDPGGATCHGEKVGAGPESQSGVLRSVSTMPGALTVMSVERQQGEVA